MSDSERSQTAREQKTPGAIGVIAGDTEVAFSELRGSGGNAPQTPNRQQLSTSRHQFERTHIPADEHEVDTTTPIKKEMVERYKRAHPNEYIDPESLSDKQRRDILQYNEWHTRAVVNNRSVEHARPDEKRAKERLHAAPTITGEQGATENVAPEEDRIAELERQLRDAQTEAKEVDSANRNHFAELQQANARIVELQGERDALEEENRILKQQLEAQQLAIKELVELQKTTNKQIKSLTAQVAELAKVVGEAVNKLERDSADPEAVPVAEEQTTGSEHEPKRAKRPRKPLTNKQKEQYKRQREKNARNKKIVELALEKGLIPEDAPKGKNGKPLFGASLSSKRADAVRAALRIGQEQWEKLKVEDIIKLIEGQKDISASQTTKDSVAGTEATQQSEGDPELLEAVPSLDRAPGKIGNTDKRNDRILVEQEEDSLPAAAPPAQAGEGKETEEPTLAPQVPAAEKGTEEEQLPVAAAPPQATEAGDSKAPAQKEIIAAASAPAKGEIAQEAEKAHKQAVEARKKAVKERLTSDEYLAEAASLFQDAKERQRFENWLIRGIYDSKFSRFMDGANNIMATKELVDRYKEELSDTEENRKNAKEKYDSAVKTASSLLRDPKLKEPFLAWVKNTHPSASITIEQILDEFYMHEEIERQRATRSLQRKIGGDLTKRGQEKPTGQAESKDIPVSNIPITQVERLDDIKPGDLNNIVGHWQRNGDIPDKEAKEITDAVSSGIVSARDFFKPIKTNTGEEYVLINSPEYLIKTLMSKKETKEFEEAVLSSNVGKKDELPAAVPY